MVGIVWRNDHSNDCCKTVRTEIRVALAPKSLDLFQPFLRGFVTVERLLPEIENEGFFSFHLPRPEGVLDRNHPIEDPGVGQAFALGPTFRVAANARRIARRTGRTLVANAIVALSHGQGNSSAISRCRHHESIRADGLYVRTRQFFEASPP